MQDNEFEKQVRDKLTGLNIDAGESVWDKVEDRLHQKEKRGRWLIWIPLGLTGILLSAVFLSQIATNKPATPGPDSAAPFSANSSGKRIMTDGSRLTPTKQQEESEKTALSERHLPGSDESKKLPFDLPFNKSNKSIQDPNQNTTNSDNLTEGTIQSSGKERLQTSTRPVLPLSQPGKRNANFQADRINLETKTPGKIEEEKEQTVISGESEITGITTQPVAIDSSSPEEIYPAPIPKSLIFERSIAVIPRNFPGASMPPQKISSSNKRFAWGMEAGFGRSGITSGKLDNLFYSPAASFSNYSATNLNSSGGSVFQSPSQVRPGLAMGLGFFIRQDMDEPLYLKAGVRYDLYTTSILVGNRVDQSVRLQSADSRAEKSVESYYTSAKTEKYVNRYNFLDIPVAFGIKFARYRRIPFAWELGISPGLLIASNALNYNKSSAIYYKDNSLFRKTQMQLFTSLPVRFFNGKAYALEIVPGFSYTSSGLFKPELDERKHLLSAGISLRASF